MQPWLNQRFFNNSVQDYIIVIGIVILGSILLKILRYVVIGRMKAWSAKTSGTLDDFLVSILEKSAMPVLYIGLIYAALRYLRLPTLLIRILHDSTTVIVAVFVIRVINASMVYGLTSFLKSRHPGDGKEKEVRGMLVIFKGLIWILGVVFLMENLGYNVTTVLTGLGIGGVAIALAAQAVLGDLFAYFVIFFDRPFEVGDFIIVGDKAGTVDHVGIKTTRIRSLSGEEIIISNKDLTDSRVHNYKRMETRRIVFRVGVTYDTSPEKLEQIPAIVQQIITAIPQTRFDRAHFATLAGSDLEFEVVYFMLTSDYTAYMDAQQQINLSLYRSFRDQGIDFAFPTQTVYLANPAPAKS